MEYIDDDFFYYQTILKYRVRVERKVLRADKGIPVKWFYLIKERYRQHYDIENIIIE